MTRRLHSLSDLSSLFGPDAKAPVIKNGSTAEAGCREVLAMLNIAEQQPKDNEVAKVVRRSEGEIARARAERWIERKLAEAQDSPVTETVNLTPALAEALLARNPNNRKLSALTVEKYARDIATSRWDFNGTSVVVALNGELNDGQHRCHAVVRSNRSITVVVVFGPARDSRMTLDQNRVRTVGDYLGMSGESEGNRKAAVCNYIFQYRAFNRLSRQSMHRPTKSEALSIAASHPEVDVSLSAVPQKNSLSVGGRSLLCFCHWAFARAVCNGILRQAERRGALVQSEDLQKAALLEGQRIASKFIGSLLTGAGLSGSDPILYARNRLINQKARMHIEEKAELIFRAWNAHRLNQGPRTLVVSGDQLPALEA